MGLENNNGNRVYLNVADGKLIQRFKQESTGTVSRVNKNGVTVHEKIFSAVSGMLRNVTVSEKEFAGKMQKNWNFEIEDGSDMFLLQIDYSSGYSSSLLKALANPVIDFSQPIRFAPWMKVINDKKKTSIYLSQGGEDIKWYFTKEEPNGLPEMKKITFKGEDKWDDYDMMQFFEQYVKNVIIPKLSSVSFTPSPQTGMQPSTKFETADTESYSPDNAPDLDDLPF